MRRTVKGRRSSESFVKAKPSPSKEYSTLNYIALVVLVSCIIISLASCNKGVGCPTF